MTRATGLSSAPAARRARAVQSFKSAADCIGPVTPGMSLFAITRGQFSMIDAVLHVLDQVGPARVSIWTWTIADYEIQAFTAMMHDGRITGGTLVIDQGARYKNQALIDDWRRTFGPDSVRWVRNHSKIALVETDTMRVALRGSMNLNFNPRFEQLDITEGGLDFDLIQEIQDELPILPDTATVPEVFQACRLGEAFEPQQLAMFQDVKTWKPTPK